MVWAVHHQHQLAKGGAGGAGGGGGAGGAAGSASAGNTLTGVGNTSVNSRSAPNVALAPIGGGGFDCPVVGFSAAGSGLGGGGGFGPAWISKSCNNRKVAELLYGLYGPEVARQFMLQNIDGVAEAVEAASKQVPPPAESKTVRYRYDYCYSASAGELKQHKECQLTSAAH